MSMDDDFDENPPIEVNVAHIKWYIQQLYRFCEGDGPPRPDLETRLAKLLQNQAMTIAGAVQKETTPFGFMFGCNLILLALILWRVW